MVGLAPYTIFLRGEELSTNLREDLKDSLEKFAKDCNSNERLMVMNKDWNRVIHVCASDIKCDYTLISKDGSISLTQGMPTSADMVVQSSAEILTSVFYGEVSPNEPYNEGTLRVQGSEQDVLRLDFITAMLWEE